MKDKNNISKELLEIIERYINGSMTSQELKDFNQLLELDNDFKLKVEDVKTMLTANESQPLKEQLNEFNKGIPKAIEKNSSERKVKFLNFSKIAAPIAVIIAIASIWFFSSPQNENLYSKYFRADPGLPTTTHSTDNFDFYEAMEKYNHGDYEIAIAKWRVLQEKKTDNDTLNYFLGVALLANKNVSDAIPFLERTVQSKDSFPLIINAHYYLGLAYLKAGNTELTIKHLSYSETEAAKIIISKLTK